MIVLVLIFVSSGFGQDTSSDLLRMAKECFDAQKTDEGMELVNKAIALKPDFDQAYHLRARVYINLKEFQKAADDCTKLIALRPDAAEGYMLRGLAYLSLNKPNDAITDLTKAIELWPNEIDGYMMRAVAYANVRDFSGSIHDCTKAIALAPDMAFLYFTRATSELQQREFDEALLDLRKILALEPARTDMYILLGMAHEGKGNIDSAFIWTDRAAADTGTAAAANRNLGFLYLAKDDRANAIKFFSKSIDQDTSRERCRAMLGLAAAYFDEQKTEEAQLWISRARSVEPDVRFDRGLLVRFENGFFLDSERRAYDRVLNGL